ncbi:MAG: DUF445 family protein [Treponema sp.]|jgi:uncharacterized membrane protein YheB (UPF0754 family)|nr:DUF445 family protein [Treponema sp.]
MPVSLLVEVLVSIVLGGLVGWITNVIAVTMLFKKYGKWGGIIEDRYQEFIASMSQLVEDDLVNGKTLKSEFNSSQFKKVLHQWIESVLDRELPVISGTTRFEDIPGIEATVEKLLGSVEDITHRVLPRLIAVIGHKKISSLVSEKQYRYMVDTAVTVLLRDADTYQYTMQQILAVFLDGKVIKNLISERALRQIAENIGDSIRNIDFSSFDRDITGAYNQVLKDIDLDGLIGELQNAVGDMRFSAFVNNPQNLSTELVNHLVTFAQSSEGQKWLGEIITEFLMAASRISLKIADVVSPSVQDGIDRFCKEQMPGIIDQIISFICGIQDEIEDLVNETVDRQLDATLGGKIGKLLKDIFIGNLAKKFNIIERIVSVVRKEGQGAGEQMAMHIRALLETKTIGEIITIIRSSGILKVEHIVDLINLNVKDLPQKEFHCIDGLLDKRIGDSFGAIDLSVIRTVLLPRLFEQIKQEYLFNDPFKRDIRSTSTKKILEMANQPLSDIFDITRIPMVLNEKAIKNTLFNAWDQIARMNISALIGAAASQESPITIKRASFEALWDTHKVRELKQLYKGIQNESVYTKVAEGIMAVVNQNIDALLTGNVSKLVNDQLGALQPAEVNTMVQEFMGKEMKSINLLGAVLGALIGFVSAWAAVRMNLPAGFNVPLLAAYGGIFALLGIGTNWLAIKMLFRPYKAIVKGAAIPPFIGIVAARKPEFAKNIADFVKKRMLGDDALKHYFDDHKTDIKDTSKQWIADANYAIIDTLLGDASRLNSIATQVFLSIRTYITDHRFEIAQKIKDTVKQFVDDGRLDDLVPALQDIIVQKLKDSDMATIIQGMIKEEIAGKNLGDYGKAIESFTDSNLKRIVEVIIRDVTKNITVPNIKNLIYQQDDQLVTYIATHTIEELAGSSGINGFFDKLIGQTGPFLRKGIEPIVQQLEKQQLNPDIALWDLFDGAIPKIIEKNLVHLIMMVCRELQSIKGDLIIQIQNDMPIYTWPWKKQVAPIVHTLMDEMLPVFLKGKQDHLLRIANSLLTNNRLSDLGFNNRSLKIEAIERTVAAILDSSHIQQGVTQFVRVIIKQFAQIPLKTLLDLINISHIHDIVRIVEPLLEKTVSRLKDNFARDAVIDTMTALIKKILMDVLKSVAVADLIKDIDLDKELQGLVKLLVADQKVIAAVSDMVADILYAVLQDASFYDEDTLRNDMETFIITLDQAHDWDHLQTTAVPYLKELCSKLNGLIAPETKDALCDYLISAIINACAYNFDALIHSIDVQVVVEREINNMHPRCIETMFYKFAGTYFTKITFYGWIGIFGGIASYIISFMLKKGR